MNSPITPSQLPSTAKPPLTERGVSGWLYHNLFNSVGNTLLTIATAPLLLWAGTAFIQWILNAVWQPIWENRKLFAVGPYPADQLIQPLIVLFVICLLFGLSAGRWGT